MSSNREMKTQTSTSKTPGKKKWWKTLSCGLQGKRADEATTSSARPPIPKPRSADNVLVNRQETDSAYSDSESGSVTDSSVPKNGLVTFRVTDEASDPAASCSNAVTEPAMQQFGADNVSPVDQMRRSQDTMNEADGMQTPSFGGVIASAAIPPATMPRHTLSLPVVDNDSASSGYRSGDDVRNEEAAGATVERQRFEVQENIPGLAQAADSPAAVDESTESVEDIPAKGSDIDGDEAVLEGDPPDYKSVVSDDEESGFGSIDITISGKTYSLQTDESADTNHPIPDELLDLVDEECMKHDISVMLEQSVDDFRQIWLVGENATRLQEVLEIKIHSRFPPFMIFTDNSVPNQRTNEFDKTRKTLKVTKKTDRDHKEHYETDKWASCELILQGRNVVSKHAPRDAIYVFAAAHFLLETKDCEELLKEDVSEDGILHKRREIAARSVNTHYFLQMHYPPTLLSLRAAPVLFSYRHYKQQHGIRHSVSHCSAYLNDSALLEIDSDELKMDSSGIIPPSDLKKCMHRHRDGTKLGCILPLRDPKNLDIMSRSHVRVKVGNSTGHMVFPSRVMGNRNARNRRQLHHIQFITTDDPLMSGESGKIVYVIDAKTGEYYRFGELIGESLLAHRSENNSVYQAIVLRQALDEFGEVYKNSVTNLRLLGQERTEDDTPLDYNLQRENQKLPLSRKSDNSESMLSLSLSSRGSTRPPSSSFSSPRVQRADDSGMPESMSILKPTDEEDDDV